MIGEPSKDSHGQCREEDTPIRKQGKFLVGYRGVDTARRQRLTKLLRRCGIWMQPGVYLVEFRRGAIDELIEIGREVTQAGGDIWVWPLCKTCQASMGHYGGKSLDEESFFIV